MKEFSPKNDINILHEFDRTFSEKDNFQVLILNSEGEILSVCAQPVTLDADFRICFFFS